MKDVPEERNMTTETQHAIHPDLAVIEATLASGALLKTPASAEPSGRQWRVRIFEYGPSKNRYFLGQAPPARAATAPLRWTRRSAQAAMRHLDGARCFAGHVSEGLGGGHSMRNLVGFFSGPAIGQRGPEATLTLLESEAWARTKLRAAWQAGRMDWIGFSVDAVIGVRPASAGALQALDVEEIVAIHSVDMVSAASSGGRALEVLEQNRRFEPWIAHPALVEQGRTIRRNHSGRPTGCFDSCLSRS
jgi:hypothetical protein